MPDQFKPLTPAELAGMYKTARPGRRAVIEEFVNALFEMQRDAIEQAVSIKEQEGFPEVNELINYIKSK